jgi:hypothetical protein
VRLAPRPKLQGAKLVKHSDDSATGRATPERTPEAQRRRREAEALRQNLLKRKSQQRGRRDQPNPSPAPEDRGKSED